MTPDDASAPKQTVGVIDPAYWRPRPGFALRTHRRVLIGYGRGKSLPGHLRAVAAQAVRPSPPQLDLSAETMEVFAEATGVSPSRQLNRLTLLAAKGVPARAAWALGLVRDGWPQRWPEYAFDAHTLWNLCASGQQARRQIDLLGDKSATTDRLVAHGIAVAATRFVTPAEVDHTLAVLLPQLLSEHGAAFLKPNRGSRGEGAFTVDSDRVVRRHQTSGPVSEPESFLRGALGAQPMVIQPRLRTDPALATLVDAHDVVTIRVVTRQSSAGPTPFSVSLELPHPIEDHGRAYYDLLNCDVDGTVRGSVRPRWLRSPDTLAPHAHPLVGDQLEVVATAAQQATHAHRTVPRVFAVAWDIALTTDGPLVLEGNTGFGTIVPQGVSNGLFHI